MDFRKTIPSAPAAYYIGMSDAWLRKGRVNNDPDAPPYIRVGRSVRYFPEELDRWLASRPRHGKVSCAPEAPAQAQTSFSVPPKPTRQTTAAPVSSARRRQPDGKLLAPEARKRGRPARSTHVTLAT
jgi:hypothetical protein